MLKVNNVKKALFITSTGTELGKTYCTVEIIKNLISKNFKVNPYKPILSGFDNNNFEASDSYKILSPLEKFINLKKIKSITPWCFKYPIAPSLAAKKEEKSLKFEEVLSWCAKKVNSKDNRNSIKLFEGAGGLFVPIEKNNTILDLIKNLDLPLILVVGNYLGSVSHTISAVKNILNLKLNIVNIIINQNNNNDININDTEYLLKESLNKKIKIRKIYKNNKYNGNEFEDVVSDVLKLFYNDN